MTLVCSLQRNIVGKGGAEALAEALKMNTTLQTLKYAAPHPCPCCQQPLTLNLTVVFSLFNNLVGPEGAESLGEALKTNSTLKELKYAPPACLPFCQQPLTPPFDSLLQFIGK